LWIDICRRDLELPSDFETHLPQSDCDDIGRSIQRGIQDIETVHFEEFDAAGLRARQEICEASSEDHAHEESTAFRRFYPYGDRRTCRLVRNGCGQSASGVRAALSSLLNSKACLSGEMALRIEKAFGVKMDTLMRMQSSYAIAQTRSHV
jgi:hypothetical protein